MHEYTHLCLSVCRSSSQLCTVWLLPVSFLSLFTPCWPSFYYLLPNVASFNFSSGLCLHALDTGKVNWECLLELDKTVTGVKGIHLASGRVIIMRCSCVILVLWWMSCDWTPCHSLVPSLMRISSHQATPPKKFPSPLSSRHSQKLYSATSALLKLWMQHEHIESYFRSQGLSSKLRHEWKAAQTGSLYKNNTKLSYDNNNWKNQ